MKKKGLRNFTFKGGKVAILNETRYDSRDIFAIARAAMRETEYDLFSTCRWGSIALKIIIGYSRSEGTSGWAYLGGPRIVKIRLPRQKQDVFEAESHVTMFNGGRGVERKHALCAAEFARVFEHELLHVMGEDHDQMPCDVNKCTQDVMWASGLRLRFKRPRPLDGELLIVKKLERASKKVETCMKEVKEVENILRRKKTQLSVWKRRAAAYGRIAAKGAARR